MADRAPKSNAYKSSQQKYDAVGRNSDYSYPSTNAAGLGHRYPHPITAYGNNASPAPASGAGTAGRHLTAEGKLPPPNEEAGAKNRDVADATNVRRVGAAGPAGPAAAAAGGQRRPPGRESTTHRGGGPRPHPGGRETRGGGETGHIESVGQAPAFLRRTAQAQPGSPASSHAQGSSARGTSASFGSVNPQSRRPHAPIPPGVSKSTTPPSAATGAAAHPATEACVNLEAVGDRRLGEPAEARRAMTCEEAEGLSAFMGCPLTDCPMHRAQGIGEGWMARHLASHTILAAEMQRTDEYVTCSVAEVLHEMCSDVEVPPSQRKFERRKMSRALFNRPRAGLGMVVGAMETKVTGNDSNPLVRRCAYDLARGNCDGLNDPSSIVRCDMCHFWSHISCGGVATPLGYGGSEDNKQLCRACLPRMGPLSADPSGAVQKEEAATVRRRRKDMLRFLERDVATGWPQGVFDLNMSAEDSSARTGCSADGKRVTDRGHSTGRRASHGNRPPCAAKNCDLPSRPDSRYCSDGCGVLTAELELSKALRHSLEEKGGNERGRRLLEIKEAKLRKIEVSAAARRLGKPRAPGLRHHHEEELHAMVHRRWRLWKRLIEIGAYWEKVSGYKNLLATTTAAKTAARQAGATIQSHAAASGKKKGKERTGGGGDSGSGSGSGSGGVGGGAGGSQAARDAQLAGNAGSPAVEGGKSSLVATALAVEDIAKKHVAEIKAAKAAERERRNVDGGAETGSSLGALCAEGDSAVSRPGKGGTAVAEKSWSGGDGDTGKSGASAGKTPVGAKQGNTAVVPTKTPASGTLSEVKDAEGQPQAGELTGARKASGKSSAEAAAAEKSNAEGATPKVPTPRPESSRPTRSIPSEAGPSAAACGTPTPLGDGEPEADLDVDVGDEMDDSAAERNAPAPHPGAVADGRQVTAAAAAAATKNTGVAGATPVGGPSAERPGESSRPAKKLKRAEAPPQGPSQAGGGAQPLPLPPPPSVVTTRPRYGVEEITCAYCGEATGAGVAEHLEECYQKLTALRNARQDHATLRPIANRPSVPQGASRSLSAAAAANSGSLSLDGASAIGRQLLGRRVPYADFDALPDPQAFQLHRDLQGWTGSPSRLDFLYKELVRQRNAAITELQSLDRQEEALERSLRQEWMADELSSGPFHIY